MLWLGISNAILYLLGCRLAYIEYAVEAQALLTDEEEISPPALLVTAMLWPVVELLDLFMKGEQPNG